MTREDLINSDEYVKTYIQCIVTGGKSNKRRRKELYDFFIKLMDELLLIEQQKRSAAISEYAQQEAIAFLDGIRDYERESGNRICDDERTSEELFKIFKQQP